MRFNYVAYDKELKVINGHIEADNENEAWQELTGQKLKVLSLKGAWRLPPVEEMFPSLFKIGATDLIRFCKQTASILESGGTLIRALQMLQAETSNRVMRRVLGDILKEIDSGNSLSGALAEHPTIFKPLFVSVVEVGEHTGRLAPALLHLAEMIQRDHEAKQKAIRTLMYPLAIMGLSLATLAILLTVAMPPLLNVFETMDTEIPLMTKIALAAVTGVREHFLKVALGGIVLAVAFKLGKRSPTMAYALDKARLKVPLVGSLTLSGEIARFSRTMTMLLDAGVPLSSALQQCITGCGNLVLRKAFVDADERMLAGETLVDGLKEYPIIPSLFLQFVTIGEESNTLDRTMREAADTYQAQQENMLNAVMGLMEPASTLMVGGTVGFIAFSMFVPIYSAMSALG